MPKDSKRYFSLRACLIAFIILSILLGLVLAFPYSENSETVLSSIQIDEKKSVSLRLHKLVPRIMRIPITRYYLDVRENRELTSLAINPNRRFYDALHIRMARTTLKDSEFVIVFDTKETPMLIAVYDIHSHEFVIGDKLAPELNFLAQDAFDAEKKNLEHTLTPNASPKK